MKYHYCFKMPGHRYWGTAEHLPITAQRWTKHFTVDAAHRWCDEMNRQEYIKETGGNPSRKKLEQLSLFADK